MIASAAYTKLSPGALRGFSAIRLFKIQRYRLRFYNVLEGVGFENNKAELNLRDGINIVFLHVALHNRHGVDDPLAA